MSEIEQLLREYIEEHRSGAEANPHDYLSRIEGTDRTELAALIDGYLAQAPRRPFDRATFERSPRAREFVDSFSESITGRAGLWPTILPRLRDRARLPRGQLVSELAERLGAQGKREKVAHYYNDMEHGLIPSEGVSDRVLEALGQIVGQSKEALRRWGMPFMGEGPAEAAAPAAAFARVDVLWDATAPGEVEARVPDTDEWDEVDRMFLGG
jgi:hypothetical protein